MRKRRAKAESDGGEAPLYVFGDYTHLDADGHAAVADAVRRVLLDCQDRGVANSH